MSLVILDGTQDDAGVGWHLRAYAEARHLPVTHFALADMTLAPCLGDFECWTKTPGRCRTQDGAQDIAQAVRTASLVVFLTPIRFGGYSANLKKAVDRLIGLVHPYFHDRDGLTRHQPRYASYAPFLFIGIAEHDLGDAEQPFNELAMGNAVNLIAPGYLARIIVLADPGWRARLDETLARAMGGDLEVPVSVPEASELFEACRAEASASWDEKAPRSVTVLVGSARPKGTSTSEWLADRLVAGFDKSECRVKKVYASQFIKLGRAADQALEEMLASDMLIVAAPIYVDGLPYLVVSALEQLAARLGEHPHALCRMVGLLNCGYPEAIHNRLAMRMLRHFARQGGLRWAGGLALGGGEALQGGMRDVADWAARNVVRALRMAAAALAGGGAIPAEATRLMARPLVPARLYRWLARLHWLRSARAHGLGGKQLAARPWE
ncbi:MAG: NAD(P)H-dependent oxidoreductase [Hydrogenophilales bacterium]|nr:NAD(P)H-dependent oxidoreductase [Hydrogenophilales bacterium]